MRPYLSKSELPRHAVKTPNTGRAAAPLVVVAARVVFPAMGECDQNDVLLLRHERIDSAGDGVHLGAVVAEALVVELDDGEPIGAQVEKSSWGLMGSVRHEADGAARLDRRQRLARRVCGRSGQCPTPRKGQLSGL